ncbi:MAG: hypothetical protein J7647_32540 [Cyanobacteria bacterium SBLK]|nr:hypothetical protein [Cyanobacteria bacterium SBLK]
MNKQVFFVPFLWSLVLALLFIASRIFYYITIPGFENYNHLVAIFVILLFVASFFMGLQTSSKKILDISSRFVDEYLEDSILVKEIFLRELQEILEKYDFIRESEKDIKAQKIEVKQHKTKLDEEKKIQIVLSALISLTISLAATIVFFSRIILSKITVSSISQRIKDHIKQRSLIEKYLAFNLISLIRLSFLVSLFGMILSVIFRDVSPLCLDILSAIPVLYALRYWILLWRIENELFGRNYFEVKELIKFIESRYKKNDDDFGSNGGERVFPYVGASNLSVPEGLTQAGEGA